MAKFLLVSEIFDSLQGEGPFLHPAIFLRTALCNLSCKGFDCSYKTDDGRIIRGCDTIRAVDPYFMDKWLKFSDKESIIKRIEKHIRLYPFSKRLQDIVVTGGEPLLHIENSILLDTLEHFYLLGHQICFETNASLDIEFKRDFLKDSTFAMGIKLSDSLEEKTKRVNTKTINYIFKNSKNSYLKFVVSKENFDAQIDEIREILSKTDPAIQVFLMPKAKDMDELEKNCRFVIEKCIEYGFNYTDRSHIRAWNTKEGV